MYYSELLRLISASFSPYILLFLLCQESLIKVFAMIANTALPAVGFLPDMVANFASLAFMKTHQQSMPLLPSPTPPS